MNVYEQASVYVRLIEDELRKIGVWREEPLPPEAYESNQAFFADTMSFYHWLQFVLASRVGEIVARQGDFPKASQVGAYAVRELDGATEAAGLIELLCEFDAFIRDPDSHPPRTRAEPPPPPPPPPEAPPDPLASLTPEEITELYWRTREAVFLHPHPRSHATFDARVAVRVFDSVTRMIELLSDGPASAEGIILRTVVDADRGRWVILTALRREGVSWRVDLPLSISRTMEMYLRQRSIHPPYAAWEDARGRAIQFWSHLQNNNIERARECTLPRVQVPELEFGELDEFFWYLDDVDEGDECTVRVLMNTAARFCTWFTTMVRQDGRWYVSELLDAPIQLS